MQAPAHIMKGDKKVRRPWGEKSCVADLDGDLFADDDGPSFLAGRQVGAG